MTKEIQSHDDLTELESAAHYLREAATIQEIVEDKTQRRNDTLDFVNEALDAIGRHIDNEMEKMQDEITTLPDGIEAPVGLDLEDL